MSYKDLFFDLDDMLQAFSLSAHDTYEEMYWKHEYSRFFDPFEHYYSLCYHRNLELWAGYTDGKMTEEELNRQHYLYPLKAIGIRDSVLTEVYEKDVLAAIPTRSKLVPHTCEVSEYLSSKYSLYILLNGSKELQSHKMHSSGIGKCFKKVVLSDDTGALKPWSEIFCSALLATQSELKDPLIIGDNQEDDIAGAAGVEMHQVLYNLPGRMDLPSMPTYQISDLKGLLDLL